MTAEEEKMLKAEESEEHRSKEEQPSIEAAVTETATNQQTEQTGPQPPPSYVTQPISNQKSNPQRRKLQFNMSKKIKIIPQNRQGQLNTTFLATIPGVLKIAEIVLAFLSFILAICADRNATTAAFTENISFAASIIISGLLLGYVCFPHLTIKDDATREGLIVAELVFYGIYTLLFFIAIWLMVHLSASWLIYGRGSAILDAVICVALTILCGLETIVKFRAWRGENESFTTVTHGAHSDLENRTTLESSRTTQSNVV